MTRELLSSVPGLLECRQQTLGDPKICIAIIDSRVDLAHPCFTGAQLRELMPAWLQSVMGPSGASHGTHVASVIFGQPGGPVEGIAPRCRGIVIPVYGETESGELRPCRQEDLARAIALALEAGANLINISGGELIRPGDIDRFLEQTVRSCEQQDVVVVAATGNDGCECLHAPAVLPAVLAVGAADSSGMPMPFSNWDESLADHGVLAPGQAIPGAVPGNGIVQKSGTSFACPIVTGAAALLLSLQKSRGERPSPKAVRDAIIGSALPCTTEEQSQCERMLGGRLNISGASEMLLKGHAVTPSAMRLRAGALLNSIRSPPTGIAQAARARSDGGIQSLVNLGNEGAVMTNEQMQAHPQGVGVSEQALAFQGFEAPHVGIPAPPMQPAAVGAREPSFAGAGAAPVAEAPPVAVRPQGASGGCSCGAQPQQSSSPHQHAATPVQQEGMMAQRPTATAPQAGLITPPPFGVQPAITPAQRTAMMAGLGGSAGGQHLAMPAVRGVAPSQTNGNIPMPTDFINSSNSQLVYVTGELGYDFITDARRDYFVQQFRAMSEDHEFISRFTGSLGLEPGPLYLPEDNRAMAAYLCQGRRPTPDDPEELPFGKGPTDIGSVVWILIQEGQPLYAIRPLHTFAVYVLQELANFLLDQSRPEFVNGTEDKEHKDPNPKRSERVSIAARILGDITLYNGQQVPVLDASLRALFNWNLKSLIEDVLGKRDEAEDAEQYDFKYDRLRNFLERIYYEVRNMGQAPSDRAINYLATNLFQANEAFNDALDNNLELDSMFAEKSPLCRPKSDCWDVVMRFFDPEHRLEKALVEHRLTVDVSDISPVGIGKPRKWSRFA
jgi:cyanobactin maturation PatA/PatG family protease